MTSGSRAALSGEFATVQQLMDAVAVAFGDREAYVDGDQRVTFGEWLARADLLAAEFVRRGVRRGDVVALMLPPSVDYAVCYAAAAKAGAVTTGLNTRIGRREVDAILGQCSPALVVRDASLGLPEVPAGTSVLPRSELAAICGDAAGAAAAREALAAVQAECEPATSSRSCGRAAPPDCPRARASTTGTCARSRRPRAPCAHRGTGGSARSRSRTPATWAGCGTSWRRASRW